MGLVTLNGRFCDIALHSPLILNGLQALVVGGVDNFVAMNQGSPIAGINDIELVLCSHWTYSYTNVDEAKSVGRVTFETGYLNGMLCDSVSRQFNYLMNG